MHSVVLLLALTTASDMTGRGRCHGGCRCSCYCGCSCGCYCGCYGGGWCGCGCYGGYGGCWGCGCYGGFAAMPYGGGYYASTGVSYGTPVAAVTQPQQQTATIVVNLPADAKLTIDGQPTRSTATRRVLQTPELQNGYTYYYTMRAEVVRDGRPVEQSQRVEVRPGRETVVSFNLADAVASSR